MYECPNDGLGLHWGDLPDGDNNVWFCVGCGGRWTTSELVETNTIGEVLDQ